MKVLVAVFALISCVLSAPSPQDLGDGLQVPNPFQLQSEVASTRTERQSFSDNDAQIVRYVFENNGIDGYTFTLVFKLDLSWD